MDANYPKIQAIDYQSDDGSVVHSGVQFADAVLSALNQSDCVQADLTGLKGASSSYFNVFLRRVDEGCGIANFKEAVKLNFDSNIQRMMFERSFDNMKRGVHRSTSGIVTSPVPLENSEDTSVWKKLIARLRGRNRKSI